MLIFKKLMSSEPEEALAKLLLTGSVSDFKGEFGKGLTDLYNSPKVSRKLTACVLNAVFFESKATFLFSHSILENLIKHDVNLSRSSLDGQSYAGLMEYWSQQGLFSVVCDGSACRKASVIELIAEDLIEIFDQELGGPVAGENYRQRQKERCTQTFSKGKENTESTTDQKVDTYDRHHKRHHKNSSTVYDYVSEDVFENDYVSEKIKEEELINLNPKNSGSPVNTKNFAGLDMDEYLDDFRGGWRLVAPDYKKSVDLMLQLALTLKQAGFERSDVRDFDFGYKIGRILHKDSSKVHSIAENNWQDAFAQVFASPLQQVPVTSSNALPDSQIPGMTPADYAQHLIEQAYVQRIKQKQAENPLPLDLHEKYIPKWKF